MLCISDASSLASSLKPFDGPFLAMSARQEMGRAMPASFARARHRDAIMLLIGGSRLEPLQRGHRDFRHRTQGTATPGNHDSS
jgi:hypothetical protein